MDIVMGNKYSGNDKMEGEFRVPLSYGTGSNKNDWFVCLTCHKPHYLRATTSGFVCKACKSYVSDAGKSKAEFQRLYEAGELFTESRGTHVRSEQAKEMLAVRDTMQVKADMYAKGRTRQSMGGQRYRKEIQRRLKENNVRPTKSKLF